MLSLRITVHASLLLLIPRPPRSPLFPYTTLFRSRQSLEKASGQDLRACFDAWVLGTVLPRLRASSRSGPAATGYVTTVEVVVEGLPRPVPLQIALDLNEGRDLREVDLGPEGGHWTFETGVPVNRVGVNDDRGLLAWIKR